jgi:hypothetical protein
MREQLKEIAFRLQGIAERDMSTAEKQIADILIKYGVAEWQDAPQHGPMSERTLEVK